VITGGPGVGKTTIVNSILRILAARSESGCFGLVLHLRRNLWGWHRQNIL
jgi:adenylate kinase